MSVFGIYQGRVSVAHIVFSHRTRKVSSGRLMDIGVNPGAGLRGHKTNVNVVFIS